ncbi:hypothetical protein CVT24_005636, partial [Panaeolus cyanescens]
VTYAVFKKTETIYPLWLAVLLVLLPGSLVPLYAPRSGFAISTTASVFGLFWMTIIACVTVYRTSPWHPLAKYPGPFVCKLTKFHLAFLSLTGGQHRYYRQLHEKYGDVVRTGPNELSLRDASVVTDLLGINGLPKSSFWDGRIPPGEKPLIAIKDKKEHSRRRRPWNRAFAPSALKGYEEIVTRRALQLRDELSKRVTQSVDLATWFSYFSYDVMNDLAFGGGSEMMKFGDINKLWHLLEASQKSAIFLSHVPWLGQLVYRIPFCANQLKAFRVYARGRAMSRRRDGSSSKDIFYHLIDEDGVALQPPTMHEIISDGALAIVAGSDTVSTAASHAFYFLVSNPTKLQRLQEEIKTLGDDLLDCTRQSQLPYLNAVIQESLRLLPPVLTGSLRSTTGDNGGQMIGKYYIPAGTTAFMATYSLHRDARCFSPLPDTFLPERWLSEDMRTLLEPEIFKASDAFVLDQSAFIPFSAGPANCVGKNLGWMELRMLITTLAHKFNFSFDPQYRHTKWCDDVKDFFVTVKGELPVIMTTRES